MITPSPSSRPHPANLENRRHQESHKTDNHPQTTPKNSSDTPTMLSKNTRLAELRYCPSLSLNRLQTPTKLVLNRAFQIATNKNLSCWKLRCSPRGERLPAAGKANGLAPWW